MMKAQLFNIVGLLFIIIGAFIGYKKDNGKIFLVCLIIGGILLIISNILAPDTDCYD